MGQVYFSANRKKILDFFCNFLGLLCTQTFQLQLKAAISLERSEFAFCFANAQTFADSARSTDGTFGG